MGYFMVPFEQSEIDKSNFKKSGYLIIRLHYN